jgi:serine/threonine protein kinase
MLEAGRKIGPYRIARLLGKGGMAEVYEVENERLGARFALKAFTLDHGDVEFLRKRFHVEGRLLARLSHPRIVRVYDMDVDSETERPYYVMDLVLDASGRPRSLRDALEGGDVTEEKAASWYEDLREGLEYIHAMGIVHRDVTLENVLVGSDGRAVLSDFGVSKILPRDLRAELKETVDTLVRGEKPLMGKSFYIAPEVAAGGDESAASDFYSLGVMMLRLLTQVWYAPGVKLDDLLLPLDPGWRRVLPPLLADKPTEREMPAWRRQGGNPFRSLVTAGGGENDVMLRIRFPHWILAGIMLFAAAAFAAVAVYAAYERGQRKMAERELVELRERMSAKESR